MNSIVILTFKLNLKYISRLLSYNGNLIHFIFLLILQVITGEVYPITILVIHTYELI